MVMDWIALAQSAREGRDFVESSRRDGGIFELGSWPRVRSRVRTPTMRTRSAVCGLRAVQRLTIGFLDPVEDALFLTAGLRRMGFAASFHIGREMAPAAPPAGFYAWVQYASEVVSTSLPVKEEYIEIYTHHPEGGHRA